MFSKTHSNFWGDTVNIDSLGKGSDGRYYTPTGNGYKDWTGTEYTPTFFQNYSLGQPTGNSGDDMVGMGFLAMAAIAYGIVASIVDATIYVATETKNMIVHETDKASTRANNALKTVEYYIQGDNIPLKEYGAYLTNPTSPKSAIKITPECVINKNCETALMPFAPQGSKNILRHTYTSSPNMGSCVSSTHLSITNTDYILSLPYNTLGNVIASSSNAHRSAEQVAKLCNAWKQSGAASCAQIIDTKCFPHDKWSTHLTSDFSTSNSKCSDLEDGYCATQAFSAAGQAEQENNIKKIYGIGIRLRHVENYGLLIQYARLDGPAYKAGLEAGDHIIEVDNKKLSSLSFEQSMKLLNNTQSKNVSIRVFRAQTKNFITISLKKELIPVDEPEQRLRTAQISAPIIPNEKPAAQTGLIAPQKFQTEKFYVVTASALNVREEASANAKKTATLLKNSCLHTKNIIKHNNFMKMDFTIQNSPSIGSGWLSADYLKPAPRSFNSQNCVTMLAP